MKKLRTSPSLGRREDARRLAARETGRRGAHGQSLVELALIAPIIAFILVGLAEFSGAYSAKMTLQAGVAEAVRLGALRPNAPTIDADMLTAITSTQGLDAANITSVDIYDATVDGAVYQGPGGPVMNSYVYSPATASFVSGTQTYLPSSRQSGEPSDELGVQVNYLYQAPVFLPGLKTIAISNRTVQHLNPPNGAIPCPISDAPVNVAVSLAAGSSGSPPLDTITWSPSPRATQYTVYSDGSLAAGFNAVTAYIFGPQVNGNQVTAVVAGNTSGPTSYEVSASNGCGEGQRSAPAVSDGNCPPLAASSNITATTSITDPTLDLVRWTPVPGAETYAITGTLGESYTRQNVAAPISSTVFSHRAPVGPGDSDTATYTVAAVNACGKGLPSATVTVSGPPAPAMALSVTDGAASIGGGDDVTYTVAYTNTAPATATATSVVVSDTLPSGLTIVKCSAPSGADTCTYAGGSAVLTLGGSGTVAGGASGAMTIVAQAAPDITGTLTSTATLSSNDAAGRAQPVVTATYTDTVAPPPTLAVSVSDGVDAVPQGGKTTYSIIITNTATTPGSLIQNVVLTDTLTTGDITTTATFTTTTGNGCAVSYEGAAGTCSLDSADDSATIKLTSPLAPGASVMLTLDAQIPAQASQGATITSTVTTDATTAGGLHLQAPPTATDTDTVS